MASPIANNPLQNIDFAPAPQLSARQRELLLAALESSNKAKTAKSNSIPTDTSTVRLSPPQQDVRAFSNGSFNPNNLIDSRRTKFPHGTFGDTFFPDSAIFDEDTTLALDDSLLEGSMEPSFEGESGEKRKSPEEGDDDDSDERREGGEKVAKKPGRKPLTTEPTTKRKAQNRAAQRAFRERKEKHLKDLENKVTDLEKASAAANHENALLRAQVSKLSSELGDYRKRMSSLSGGSGSGNSPSSRSKSASYPPLGLGSLSDPSTFNFDFSTFDTPATSKNTFNFSSNTANNTSRSVSLDQAFGNVTRQTAPRVNNANLGSGTGPSPNLLQNTGFSDSQFSDIYAAGFLDALKDNNNFGKPATTQGWNPGLFGLSGNFQTSPPADNTYALSHSSSSNSHASPNSFTSRNEPSSSCGTSPEPVTQNEPFKFGSNDMSTDMSTLSVPNSAQQPLNENFSNTFDWLANQNGGQFDPVLFNDYRDPQNAIIGDGDFSGGFFEDYDFGDLNSSLFNNSTGIADMSNAALAGDQSNTIHAAQKPSLLDTVDKAQEAKEKDDDLGIPGTEELSPECRAKIKSWKVQNIWKHLREMPSFQTGDFDIDGLCSELSQKAKCTETGLAVPQDTLKKVLKKLAESPAPSI